MRYRALFILAIIATIAGFALPANATVYGGPRVSPWSQLIHPDNISKVCTHEGSGDCIQASGRGAVIHAFPSNGNPNQEYQFFLPNPPSCGDNITDTNCPFPGTPVGKQIVVIGGQSAQNAGLCGAWTQLGFSGNLAPCNGGTGTIFVLDGFALESGLIGRQTGGKTYLCEGGGNGVAVFSGFTPGACQWSDPPQ